MAGIDRYGSHAAILDAHTRNPHEVMPLGTNYICPWFPMFTTDTLALTANRFYAMPFWVARDITVDRIAIYVDTLADPSNIRLGIYNNGTNLYPGTRLLDAGVVSGATTGVKAIAINQSLTKGLYWLVAISDAAPTVRIYRSTFSLLGFDPANFANQFVMWYVDKAYGALPSTFAAGGAVWNTPILVLCRGLSLD